MSCLFKVGERTRNKKGVWGGGRRDCTFNNTPKYTLRALFQICGPEENWYPRLFPSKHIHHSATDSDVNQCRHIANMSASCRRRLHSQNVSFCTILCVLMCLVSSTRAYDNEDFELFDLVEEVQGNFYELLGVESVSAASDDNKILSIID